MPSDDTRDVARIIRQLHDRIRGLEQRRSGPERIAVPTPVFEDAAAEEDTASDERTGGDRTATFDAPADQFDFTEFA